MRNFLFFLALAYSLALVVLSLMNLRELPDFELANVDKIYHTIAYFGLVTLWQLWYFFNSRSFKFQTQSLFIVCFLAILFGIFIEVLQGTFTVYRTWDLLDMLANLSGVVLAAICLILTRNTLEKLKNKL
ncbi:MAG TPA: VanZ family protein [Flavobacteriaceae bacterium]|nr:VanZ family protein [Flavobacteriaceae bacterium]